MQGCAPTALLCITLRDVHLTADSLPSQNFSPTLETGAHSIRQNRSGPPLHWDKLLQDTEYECHAQHELQLLHLIGPAAPAPTAAAADPPR
jgi:hypothetical protein